MTMNFSQSPYHDDYAPENNFYRILFKPSLAVQTRELNQLQAALQKQIEYFGSSVYKEGAQVLGGSFGYTNEIGAVKLNAYFSTSTLDDYIDQFVGVDIYGETTGVKATVVTVTQSNSTDAPTLFVKYTATGYNKSTPVFSANENIIAVSETVNGRAAGNPIATTLSADATFTSASANIESGVYYTQGHFVYVEAQRIILSKYDNKPSARIGLKIIESIVTSNDDSSLLDNATGTPNFAARGADRYSIQLVLSALSLSETNDNGFIELGRVVDGKLLGKIDTSVYSELEKTLARRTYDINGDYFVKPFQVRVRESLNDGINNGVFKESQVTHDDEVTPTVGMTAIQVSAGRAYIRGYEVETTDTIYLDGYKTRRAQEIDSETLVSTPLEIGSYVKVTNAYNIPEMVGLNGSADFPEPFAEVELRDAMTSVRGSAAGNIIGVCRVRSFETDYIKATGTSIIDETESIHNAYIFDVKMFTTIVTSAAHGLAAGEYVKGVTSGATGFVHSSSSGTTLNLTSVTGEFQATESVIPASTAAATTWTVVSSISNNFDAVKQLYTSAISGVTFTADTMLETTYQLTGLISTTGVTVSGFNASFISELKVGDAISIPSAAGGLPETRIVTVITDNNALTLDAPVTVDVVSVAATRLRVSIIDQNKNILVRKLAKDYMRTTTNMSAEIKREFIVQSNASSFQLNGFTGESFNASSGENYQIAVIQGGGALNVGDIINVNDCVFLPSGDTVTISHPDFGTGLKFKVNATLNKNYTTPKLKTPNRCQQLKIANTAAGVYGTSVQHAEISLGVADVYKIRAIYDSGVAGTDAVAPTLTFTATSGLFAKGMTIVGESSGASAIVVTTTSPMTIIPLTIAQFVTGEKFTSQMDSVFTSEAAGVVITTTAGNANVTNRYLLDSGQRDNFYDISRLSLKSKTSRPTGNLLVVYDYFDHEDGDFFTVSSYNSVTYDDIPYYTATRYDAETEQATGVFDLRSCVDFRPRVADATSITVGGIKQVTGPSFDFDTRSYAESIVTPNASITNVYKDNSNFEYDLTHYLARIDSLFLTEQGSFVLVEGAPSDTPIVPESIADAVRLADIYYDPYVLKIENNVRIVQNLPKHYSMADIERLEKRISNVEYYTSLSLLEKSAQTMQIKDNLGLDRFKCGFIVDNFSGHSVGDVLNEDYRCSIDMAQKILRPPYVMKNIQLEEASPTTRAANGYTVVGDIALLPYTEIISVQQPYATTVENVNPSLSFAWNGIMTLSPSSDEWFDINKLPTITQNVEGNYDAVMAAYGNSIGTVWDAPETNWSGVSTVTGVSEKTITEGRKNDVYRTITTTETGTQTQKGLQTTIVENINVTSSGDKLVSTSLIPFMRQKLIKFEAKGMKPHTRVYPYFDGIDVSRYCTSTGGSVAPYSTSSTTTIVDTGMWNSVTSVKVFYRGGDVTCTVRIETSDRDCGPWTDVTGFITIPAGYTDGMISKDLTVSVAPNSSGEKFFRIAIENNTTNTTQIRPIIKQVEFHSGAVKIDTKSYGSIASFRNVVNAYGLIDGDFGATVNGYDFLPSGVSGSVIWDSYQLLNNSNWGVTSNSDWNSFLKSLSVWKPTAGNRIEETVSVDFPYAGSYTFKASADDIISLELDGVKIMSGSKWNKPANEVTINVTTSGTKQLKITAVNTGGPRGLAVSITYVSSLPKTNDSKAYAKLTNDGEGKVVVRLVAGKSSSSTTKTSIIKPADIDPGVFITDGAGYVAGYFDLPDPNVEGNPKFESGIRQFRLQSAETTSLAETIASASYSSTGVMRNMQETITSTRNAQVLTTSVQSTTKVTRTNTTETLINTYWTDPLAQSFVVKSAGGEFITSIDLFFQNKDLDIPVTVQIREIQNGLPTRTIIPNGTATVLAENVNTSNDGTVATNFVFDAPVYLKDNVEYAIVVLSDSKNYLAWISRMGEKTADGRRFVSDQPYLGVLFKSQNNSTWTPFDLEDLKFTLYRAKFDTKAKGNLVLSNGRVNTVSLENNPFETVATSPVIKVYHKNHGMYGIGNQVEIAGSDTTTVPDGVYTVGNQGLDYYTINVATAPTTSGRVGGSSVIATENAVADSFQVMVPVITFADTAVTSSFRLSTATSPSGSQASFGDINYTNIKLGERIDNKIPGMITSELNEITKRGNAKSASLFMTLSSKVDNLSPIVDLERKSITCYMNRIDNITSAADVYPASSYNDMTSPDKDSSEAIYMTKRVQLESPATAINVYFDAVVNASANIKVLYKILRSDDTVDFDEIQWTEFPAGALPPKVTDRTSFLEYKYDVEGLQEFIGYSIKIKMDGTNGCEVPLIKNLRAIALAL